MVGLLVLFPGALGDFVCFLPTLAGLLQRCGGPLTLVVKPELHPLLKLPGATLVSMDRREVADLYGDGNAVSAETRKLLGGRTRAYSWTGAGLSSFATRLGAITAGPTHVFPFRGMQPGEHAVDYYARCAGVAPLPFGSMLEIDSGWFADFRRRHDLDRGAVLVMHPGSGSPAKNWTGFGALARRWQERCGDAGRIVVLQGPAELDLSRSRDIPQALTLRDLSLPQVAALLKGCRFYAGNDSGISHLAGAVGATGVVLFGSTDPAVWRPRTLSRENVGEGGRLKVLHAPGVCEACGSSIFCTHRLSVEQVEAALLDGEPNFHRTA